MAIGSTLLGLSILIIGDSHLATPGYLDTTLQNALIEQGAKVQSYGICGIQPADWVTKTAGNCGGAQRDGKSPTKLLVGAAAHTTPIATLVEQIKPDLVLVVMGDTMAGYKQKEFPATWAWQQAKRLTGALSKTGASCAWVGPAWGQPGGKYGKNYERVKLIGAFLAENSTPCTYIDSLTMSTPGQWATIDGQHFTAAGYASWGTAIAQAVTKLPIVATRKAAK